MTVLLDTGPLVALFDPKDRAHHRAREGLRRIVGRAVTTVPVLTEAFHLLDPGSRGALALGEFVSKQGAVVFALSEPGLSRAIELMKRYADHPMDLADASLVVAAETLGTTVIFTLDRRHFATYRVRVGRSYRAFKLHDE